MKQKILMIIVVGMLLLAGPCHLSADQILQSLRRAGSHIAKATVYNTLKLFKDKGLLRDIVVPDHVVFDSTTTPHHHFYNVDTCEVTDVPAGELKIVGTASLPPGLELDDVDVIVRVRSRKA